MPHQARTVPCSLRRACRRGSFFMRAAAAAHSSCTASTKKRCVQDALPAALPPDLRLTRGERLLWRKTPAGPLLPVRQPFLQSGEMTKYRGCAAADPEQTDKKIRVQGDMHIQNPAQPQRGSCPGIMLYAALHDALYLPPSEIPVYVPHEGLTHNCSPAFAAVVQCAEHTNASFQILMSFGTIFLFRML